MAVTINADTSNGLVITPDTSGEIEFQQNGTKMIKFGADGLELPSWTTAGRPSSPTAGLIGFNTTTNTPEWYNNLVSSWQDFDDMSTSYTVSYLVVAGGGGAGLYGGGGGGAGGMRTGTVSVNKGTGYTVTIGAGGAESNNTSKYNGSNSVFSVTSTSGGAGGTGASAGALLAIVVVQVEALIDNIQ